MPLDYLRELAGGTFPLVVTDQADIDKVAVLVAAGMVIADVPEAGQPGVAVVHELTGFGRATVKASARGAPKQAGEP